MSSRDPSAGTAWARHDTGFLDDDAILELLVDDGDPWAVLAYLAVRDASWQRGERVTLAWAMRRRAALVGQLGRLELLLERLTFLGLLDEAGMIPEESWARWYGPVAAYRAGQAEKSAKGVAARQAKTSTDPRKNPRKNPRVDPRERETDDATNVASVALAPGAPTGARQERSSPPDEPEDLWPMVDGRVQVPQGPTTFPAPTGYVDPVASFDEMAARAEPGSFLAQALERKRQRAQTG